MSEASIKIVTSIYKGQVKIDISIGPGDVETVNNALEKAVWQAKETLRAQAVKQKTWEAKEESQEVQLEQEHSIPNNDQRLHEKEHKQRTQRTSDISLCSLVKVVYHLNNTTTIYCLSFPEPFESLARQLLIDIGEGKTVCIPSTMELEIVRL